MGMREIGDGMKIFISGEDLDRIIFGFEYLEGYYMGRNVMWGLIYVFKNFFIVFRRDYIGLFIDYVSYLVIMMVFVLGVLLIWG